MMIPIYKLDFSGCGWWDTLNLFGKKITFHWKLDTRISISRNWRDEEWGTRDILIYKLINITFGPAPWEDIF